MHADESSISSEKTTNQTNNSQSTEEYTFKSTDTFFEVTLKVKPSAKPSEELWSRAATFLRIM